MPRRLIKILPALLVSLIIFSISLYLFAKPIILQIARAQLKKAFKQSSISGIGITPGFIEFQGIEINSYDLKIDKVRIYYSARSLFKREADFYIGMVNYNKLKIADAIGNARLKGRTLEINPISVNFLGGSVRGQFDISLDKDMNYNLKLNCQGAEIKRLVDDMEFSERFDMTGKLEGDFSLSGKGGEIKDINGNFYTDKTGGSLIIKDKTFLENIAKQSNQPLDIIVESFRNYNYNKGIIKLFTEAGNLVMDIELDGSSGKRSLNIVLHGFNGKGETP